jgi:hypothetical protein
VKVDIVPDALLRIDLNAVNSWALLSWALIGAVYVHPRPSTTDMIVTAIVATTHRRRPNSGAEVKRHIVILQHKVHLQIRIDGLTFAP